MDGWYHSAITTDGFTSPSDPHGGRFDYGIRTMAVTPHGVFFGTANDFYGLAIFRARVGPSSRPDPPNRVEIETTKSGGALLSWQPAPSAQGFQIWRAEVRNVLVRDDVNILKWNKKTGNKIPDTSIGPYEQIGTSREPVFIDSTVQPDKRYMYYVLLEAQGQISHQSNLVAFPLLTPPMTFAQLLDEVSRLEQRRRFRLLRGGATTVRQEVRDAQTLAAKCQIAGAIENLHPETASFFVRTPESTDLEILMSKLVRRLQLFERLPDEVSSDEFCTS
jgi:hypothetical protein